MYKGQIACQWITEVEQFDDDGNSLGMVAANPVQPYCTRFGLRVSDAVGRTSDDLPASPNSNVFNCSGTIEQFEAADADDAVLVLSYEEVVNV
mgnify:CR=1 FL=1